MADGEIQPPSAAPAASASAPAAAPAAASAPAAATAAGPGRALVAVYAVFSVAATSRAAVQIATRFDEAPVAYLLSALAGAVYVVATVALTRTGPTWRRVAWSACGLELAGVLAVGTASLVDRETFPDEAVWSGYGAGYLFVPLVLPLVGLAWLRWTGRARPAPTAGKPRR